MTVELAVRPRGPYSLAFSARFSSDATRTFRDGLFTAVVAVDGRPELARAWQSIDGTVTIRGESTSVVERLRWILALDDDHSDFLRSVRSDPMLGRASRALRGLRPLRVATVAQALLRAFCGQLIEAKRARRLEQTIIRTICAEGPEHLHVAPATADLAALALSQLRALGLHAPRRFPRPALPLDRARASARRRDRRRRGPARTRTRAGAVVDRRRLPRRTRPLRLRTRRRPRARQAAARAARPAGRGLGDGRAARALRRVGGHREHVSARRLFARSARRVTSAHGAHRNHRRRPHRRSAALRLAELGLERHRRDISAHGARR